MDLVQPFSHPKKKLPLVFWLPRRQLARLRSPQRGPRGAPTAGPARQDCGLSTGSTGTPRRHGDNSIQRAGFWSSHCNFGAAMVNRVAAYHHSGVTVALQWCSSGAVLSAPARQNFFTYKNNTAVEISLSTKNISVRCGDAAVIYW